MRLKIGRLNTASIILLFIVLASGAFAASAPSTMKPGQVFRDCPECPDMVVIPAGKFMMGMSDNELKRDQQEEPLLSKLMNHYAEMRLPQHPVAILKSFALGKYPVMHGEFAVFARETGFSTDQPCIIRTIRNRLRPSNAADWSHPGFDQTDLSQAVFLPSQPVQVMADLQVEP